MSDSRPKTDEPLASPIHVPSLSSDHFSAESELASEADLLPEADLNKEILDSSPELTTLLDGLAHAEFAVDLDEPNPRGLKPVGFIGRLKAALMILKYWLLVVPLLIANHRQKVFAVISAAGKWFKQLSAIKKIAVILWLVAAIGVSYYGIKISKGRVLNIPDGPYVFTMDDFAENSFVLDENEKREPFYDNIRISSNTFLIPKIVVNIKASASSSANPMAAFEFYVDSISADAILEVKEREPAVLDKVERRIEEFNFDELQTVEGKKHLCQEITATINSVITQGTIRRTLIKTIFLKP